MRGQKGLAVEGEVQGVGDGEVKAKVQGGEVQLDV